MSYSYLSWQQFFTEIKSTREHLLTEYDHVRRGGEIPSLMVPHSASRPTPSLHLVNNEICPSLYKIKEIR